ncbi:MAG: HYR domain-containing protein [Saprospiraceae bacterium]
MNNNNTGAPNACGGSTTVTFTVTSDCETSKTCTASFTVQSSPVVLTCPNNVTENACQTQSQIDSKFAAWLGTVSTSGGCNSVLTNNNNGAPNHCGGSASVTFTVTSDCETPKTCVATFTVSNATAVVLNCPSNVTEAACQTQTAINTKFNNWLATASFSGGCNGVLTNSGGTAPDHCGGSTSVTFTVTSDCESPRTCVATFTVSNATSVTLTCPTNVTENECQTQAQINSKFNAWLATVSTSGGCNSVLTNNNTGAPQACGGSTTVTFTVTSDCEAPKTCSASFTVTAASPVVLTCPSNVTEGPCQTQSQINSKFNAWLATVSTSGGCNPVFTNNNTGAPNACGGSTTVTFTVTSDCEAPKTCTASFAVISAPAVVLTCPNNVTEAACQTQSQIDSKFTSWLATVSFSGGCNASIANNNTGAPLACGGSKTVTFTVTSDCEAPKTCTATFAVTTAPAVVLTCPNNVTEAACQTQSQIDTKFTNWLATVSFSGGCNASIANNNTGAPLACGGSKTVTFTVTSDCEGPKSCTATFTVTSASSVVLTCANNVTEIACQTQAQIDSKFANWLNTASFSGGCNGVLTNTNTGAPNECGGSTTVTFTVTSDCEAPKTCTASFTVQSSPVVLTCPNNVTENACQTQSQIDSKFNAWLATVTSSGGCNSVLTNNNTGAPNKCGGIATVIFTVTSSCEAPKTCSATFTVSNATAVVLNCPNNVTEAACQTQSQINTKFNNWLATVTTSGGCNPVLTNNNTGAPLACGGTTSVTFSVTSDCETTKTCVASFTVTAAPSVVLTCPTNVTETACQTQAQINTKFNNWLATVSTSGGCNPVFTNNNTGAPNHCGGSTTVTFTVTSDCESPRTCAATFTVSAAPTVILTCPANVTETNCQTQATINSKFNAWLATVSTSGGCNPVFTNNNTGAPNACGGSTTVTFTVTSDCEAPKSCTASFTVTAAPAVVLTCPNNITEAACQTQAQIDGKFTNWLNSVSFSGGCNASISNNNNGAPPACGGSKTVTFTVTSDCEAPKSCTASFTVTAAPAVVLTCPNNVTEAACQTQAQINSQFNTWLATVSFSGGCNASISNNNTGAPNACGGSTTVTFTVTSSCEAPKTCTATFAVTAAPAVVLNCASNVTEIACQSQATIDAKFATWLATATSSGGCNRSLSNNNTGAPNACGGSTTVTFTVTSDCEAPKSCTASFVVSNSPVVLTCPNNVTEASCQTQTSINTKFNTWLNTVTFSGGCNASISNNNVGAPQACGGSTTVTFTVTSTCEAPKSCTATFTVTTAPAVVLTCPNNVTENACQTQSQINTKFNNWLATVSTSGGCNPVLTNNNVGAPQACGGSTTVTFTVTSDCESAKTCSAIFTVTNAPQVILTCPDNQTEAACQTTAQINQKFAAWLATASVTGGCNSVLSNNNNGAPSACGGSVTVTFTVTSDCQSTVTCTSVFTVTTAPAVSMSCPVNVTEAACQTQASINQKFSDWLATLSVSGGCNTNVSNNNNGAPAACGGSKTVIFTATSSCENPVTCSATFTVTAPSPLSVTCPIDVNLNGCRTQFDVDTAFVNWLNSIKTTGGCNVTIANNNNGAPNVCGGSKTVQFTVTSSCESPKTCSATFAVIPLAAPQITCPNNITINCDESTLPSRTGNPTGLDGCGDNGTITYQDQVVPGICSGNYIINRTWTITDRCGGTDDCVQTITLIDNKAPTFTMPNDIIIYTKRTNAGTQTLVNYDFNFGNSYVSLAPKLYSGITSVMTNSVNPFMRTNGTPSAGLAFANNPVAGKALTVANSFSSGGNWQFNISGRNLAAFTNFKVYVQAFRKGTGSATNLIMEVSTDAANWTTFSNTALTTGSWVECTATVPGISYPTQFYIRIRYSGGSNTDPKDLHIDNFQIQGYRDAKLCDFDDVPDITGYPTNISDACDQNPTATYRDSAAIADCVSKVYRTWIVTDECGNSTVGNTKQVITIEDTLGPVVICPSGSSLSRKADTTKCHYTVINNELDATATDDCFDPSTVSNNWNNNSTLSGVQLPVGVHTIIWTATDNCGNTSTCSFSITIFEIEPPVARCKGDSILLDSTGNYTITVNNINAGSTDNCGIKSMKLNRYVYGCDDIPSRKVILTVTDSTGLSDTCEADLKIRDGLAPKLTCKNISIVLPSSGTKTITADSVISFAKDNCGITKKTVTPNTFTCSSSKVTTVTVEVRDVTGNTSTCTATVTISNTQDADCDGVWDVCDVCPGGDDKVDNDGDGKPDCKFPPIFPKVKSTWKCGTNPNRVYIAKIGTNGKCTTTCVNYLTWINNPGPNEYLGPCKSCPEGLQGYPDVFKGLLGDTSDDSERNANDPESGLPFRIVPNPNYGVFDLVFDAIVEDGTLEIYNLMGEKVWMQRITGITERLSMNSNEFKNGAAGVYRIVLKNNEGKSVQTLLIMK